MTSYTRRSDLNLPRTPCHVSAFKKAVPSTIDRSCLMCGANFKADGPYIRVCESCKRGKRWRA